MKSRASFLLQSHAVWSPLRTFLKLATQSFVRDEGGVIEEA